MKSINVSRVICWTDSTDVLYWVRNQSRKFKTFVANRVGEIQETTNPEQWHHVPGHKNPADLATRGMNIHDLAESKLWLEGPQFLLQNEESWPQQDCGRDSLPGDIGEENKTVKTQLSLVADDEFLSPKNYSSFQRLIRVTAWLQRFISNCKHRVTDRVLNCSLSQQEVKRAEQYWLKRAQVEGFGDKGQKSLESLNSMKDENSLLRLGGRLHHADLPYESKHPVILPKKHPITNLVIKDVHNKLGHGSGVEHALTELRCRFWVIKGRAAVREVINHCQMCKKRFNAKPLGQMMAPLLRSRVTSTLRAFERVGVDFGGPYLTKQGRGKSRAKRYICLLDTNSFLNVFSRFASRRGTPCYVLSDNGTNFVAGDKELKELVKELDQKKIVRKSSGAGEIEWQFNPPASPHFGGVFEIMIKSAKKAIRGVLGNADVTDEELLTAICGAESLLNSRPITYVSSDCNDIYPLTPNHFIHGQAGGKFAEEATQEEIYNPRKRWHRIQQLIGQVWKRWRRELLPSLNNRKKWFSPTRNMKVGDIVLIIDPNAHRCDWPLGRIVDVYPSKDDLVSVVKVQSKGKEYLRPIHKLCPLDYA